MRVALFITCINDTFFPNTGRAVVQIIERLGHEVEFPAEQTCCGQMHVNSGYERMAIPLIRRFVEVFSDAEVIVSPSASCVALIRDQYARIAVATGDSELIDKVLALLPRVFELTEFLVDRLGAVDVGARFPRKVALHPTCHSLRLLHVGDRPRRLLDAVEGLELIQLRRPEECCGFGGTFAVKNPAVSSAMLEDKLDDIASSGAEFCVALDNSCLMHIQGGLDRMLLPVRAIHLAEILGARA